LFLFPILLLATAMEVALRHIPNDYTYKKEYLDKNAAAINTLFFGSSHMYYGVDPKYIAVKSFNASHISQLLYFDYQIFKKYENRLQNLKCVVIPIDYQSLYGRLETGPERWRVKNYNIYYGINTTNDLTEHYEVLGNKLQVNLDRLVNYYGKGITARTCTDLGWGTNFTFKNRQDLEKTGKSAGIRHTVNNDDYFNANLSILKAFIKEANKKNIKIIFVTCPVYKSYVENMNQAHLKNTIQVATDLASENRNVSYYNLLNDNRFVAHDFYDADHLNEFGAEKFSGIVNRLLLAESQKK